MIPAHWPYSAELYEAFATIQNSQFTLYCCGDKRKPYVLVASYEWDDYIDVINIRGGDLVTAARLPKSDDLDIFAPSRAVWHYAGNLVPTLAATLRLPPPHDPDAPTAVYPAPLSLFVPSCERRPMAVRIGVREKGSVHRH